MAVPMETINATDVSNANLSFLLHFEKTTERRKPLSVGHTWLKARFGFSFTNKTLL